MSLKNFIPILFVGLSCFAPCLAQNSSEKYLFPIWDERGKYGFIDTSGRVIIKPQFEEAYPSSEGLATVSLGKGKWGFIDTKGKVVIPLKYNYAGFFSDGLAMVTVKVADREYQCGYVDRTGEFVIKPRKEFIRCGDFSEGFARIDVSDPNLGETTHSYINKKGEFAIGGGYALAEPFSEGWAWVDNFSKTFFVSENGKVIDLNPLYHPSTHFEYYSPSGSFSEGLALICGMSSKDSFCKRYGFINTQGKIVFMLPEKFRVHGSYALRENRAVVEELKQDAPYFGYGYIDRTGKVVIPTRFRDARDFSGGLAVVRTELSIRRRREEFGDMVPVENSAPSKWLCINPAGRVVIEKCGEPVSDEEYKSKYQYFGKGFGKGFVHGLFFSKTYVGTGMNQKAVFGYMNKKGRYVWIAPHGRNIAPPK